MKGGLTTWIRGQGQVPFTLAASFLGSFTGLLATRLLPDGFGIGALVVGPFLVFLGGSMGAVAGAALMGRNARRWPVILGLMGGSLVMTGLALTASLPGSSTGQDTDALWQAYGFATAAFAGLTGSIAGITGTRAAISQARQQKRSALSEHVANVPSRPASEFSASASIKAAYDLIGAPTRDNIDLAESTRQTLRILDEISRSLDALAPEAKRVAAKLRTTIAREFLDRAWKSLQAAQAGQKAGRTNSVRAATLAERLSQEALEIADTERDAQVALRANQCLQAARVLNSRGPGPEAVEAELRALKNEVSRLENGSDRGPLAAGEEATLLTRLVALQGLAKVGGMKGVEGEVDRLLTEVRSYGTTSHATAAPLGENLEMFLAKVSEGIRVVRELDSGGFGRTFHCVEGPPMNRQVVVKTLRSEWLASDSVRRAFNAEANVEGSIRQNVAQVYYFREIAGRQFKVMEYVTGGSLRDQLKRWRLQNRQTEPVKAVRIVGEVIDALLDLQKHHSGAVHRDLKPENILLDDRGHAKLTDFGLAHIPRPMEKGPFKAGTPLGTVYYMSPEQARGEAVVTPASDVYALGVILYELFTGTFPYPVTQHTRSAFREYVKRGDLRIEEQHLPPPVYAVVKKCLEKEPGARPTLEELKSLLAALQQQLEQQDLLRSVWASDAVPSDVFHSLSIADDRRQRDEGGLVS